MEGSMSILQFIASIVGSISWPAAVVIVVLILRKPLTTVILSLSKVSYKDVGLECLPLSLILKENSRLQEKILKQVHESNSKELTERERK
jgi:hypothetical protein